MKKTTVEDQLRVRLKDPRGHRGAISDNGGKLRLTFGAIGDHKRVSFLVDGDEIKVIEDPTAPAPDEQEKEDGTVTKKRTTAASKKPSEK